MPPERRRPARVVIAPDSFKGSITARAAARAIAAGWLTVCPEDTVIPAPMADGGEGTLAAFESHSKGATRMPIRVSGPHGKKVNAHWLLLRDGTGVVELANTSGIELVPSIDDLLPLEANTVGFGEAIRDALRAGVNKLVLAIGGSASTDGGAGLLWSLGARLKDQDDQELPPTPRGLQHVARIDRATLAAPPRGGVTVLTDVSAPLLGPTGAATVFGPQKGASQSDIVLIERALKNWAGLLDADPSRAGAGAAGGTGFALAAWGGQLVPGAREVAKLIDLDHTVSGADLVVTGEGRFDGQSAHGKAPTVTSDIARARHIPTALIAGRIDVDTSEYDWALSLTDIAGSPNSALSRPATALNRAGALLATSYYTGR
ncbi:glycerate kinase [Microbacterium rhizomatis]|uniref:Glycerate kinase n=1 Tax=Microbacterium rhizomatis TaxID=1631477 RepID=A0A5J5IWM3_9MICO|nr:glycerate kinase [Microbacterium rhizomatis]KAA9105871.1 glycerate kinase [Microbacterium rhizomatis]